jgi:hypothetical protein
MPKFSTLKNDQKNFHKKYIRRTMAEIIDQVCHRIIYSERMTWGTAKVYFDSEYGRIVEILDGVVKFFNERDYFISYKKEDDVNCWEITVDLKNDLKFNEMVNSELS